MTTSANPGLAWALRDLAVSHEGVLAVILACALLALSTQTEQFLTRDNLLNQGRLLAEVGLVALPMTFIIITGGIDLSVGAIMGLCAIVLGYAWKNLGLPLALAIVAALATGALAGWVNGWFITRVPVPPLIMTLATLAFYRDLAEGISQARSVRGYPSGFSSRAGRLVGGASPAMDFASGRCHHGGDPGAYHVWKSTLRHRPQ
ncbi:MAG: hypothetical protein U1F68_08225 [Gammaproteobacteria bacterium]